MDLLISPASPFVRKARIAARLLNMMDVLTEVEVTATAVGEPTERLIAANPVGKIPTLIRKDGPAIYDSRVITRYLNEHASGTLYPEARLWEVLTLEATGDGIMEAAVLIIYEERFRKEKKRSADWVDGQWSKVARGLDALETRWMSHLHGPLDMAQVSVGCALGYLDFRHDARNWRAGRPNLAAWFETFSQRPEMVETKPG